MMSHSEIYWRAQQAHTYDGACSCMPCADMQLLDGLLGVTISSCMVTGAPLMSELQLSSAEPADSGEVIQIVHLL